MSASLMKILVLNILLMLAETTAYGRYLWDLKNDPTESTNLYNDTTYADLRDELIERLAYWEGLLGSDDDFETVSGGDVETAAFEECGGVCPYVNDTYSHSIDQIYHPTDPPNIIFVLVDDWGYNDIGYRSTYMNWTTPTIDKLAREGIILDSYFTHDFCTPSRAALMRGRFAGRLGMLNDYSSTSALPVSEITMAQELKSAGYVTHIVGKWDLGFDSLARFPTYRGFDSFYGYCLQYIDYYTKEFEGYLDLHHGVDLVTSATELSENYHSTYLFQAKAEEVIRHYSEANQSKPLFLYYAVQLVHGPFEVPLEYIERCADTSSTTAAEDDYIYCGMNLMLDEVVANLICVLEEFDMLDNTVFILASDNGGVDEVTGTSVPFRGHKFELNRGGISANAFITSSDTGDSARHGVFWSDACNRLVAYDHVTGDEWRVASGGNTIDGVDMWDAIISNLSSPRSEIVHYVGSKGEGSIQIDMLKLDLNISLNDYDVVTDYFTHDLAPDNAHTLCDNPYLVSSDDDSTDAPKTVPTTAPSEMPTDAPTEEHVSRPDRKKSSHKQTRLSSESRRSLSGVNSAVDTPTFLLL